MVKFEMKATIINEIYIGEANPEKAGVGGSIRPRPASEARKWGFFGCS
jgi:hypothetical protein